MGIELCCRMLDGRKPRSSGDSCIDRVDYSIILCIWVCPCV